MPGKVTIFNSYNEPISDLSVHNYSVGSVGGWSTGEEIPRYTPKAVTVDRVKHADEVKGKGAFALGPNLVSIPWDSFTGSVTVEIPDPAHAPVSLDDDLILYLTVNKAILMTTRGYVLNVFDVVE